MISCLHFHKHLLFFKLKTIDLLIGCKITLVVWKQLGFLFVYFVFIFVFSNFWQHLATIPVFWGPYVVPQMELEPATCKGGALSLVLSL